LADFVIPLGPDGHIEEQGTISEPENPVAYARVIPEHNPDDDFIAATPPVKDEETAQIPSSREGSGLEMSRQSGDMKVYSYYFRSVGWLASIAFCISQISFAFFFVFPSERSTYP
jgi:ATP-binding cassette subfamily C (CFTR/MRP) protein 1